MCTVTFYPVSKTSFILTSNRDEAPGRDTLAPAIYTMNEVQCLYPKDAVAGGTWIGVSEKKRLICLLNGGFKAHKREQAYSMSRGIVVKNLLVATHLAKAIAAFNFKGIEPFTVIAIEYLDSLTLSELVWDGVKAHFTEKPMVPTIWSSSLLYTQEMKQKRVQWFTQFLENNKVDKTNVLDFHKTAGEGSKEYDLIMNRGFVQTKSITQITYTLGQVAMRYEDLQVQKISEAMLS